MSNVVIVGTQWGDEGKGKIIDILTRDADIIVRFQGGPNAGHTVVVDEKKIILHQVPSGILHADKTCVVGSGVVLDLESLFVEIDEVKANGYFQHDDSLLISEQAHLIMPYHKKIDIARENKKGREKIGTTGRGIGPAYEDKTARQGIRLIDIFDDALFQKKLNANLEEKNWYLREHLQEETFEAAEIIDRLAPYRDKIEQYLADTTLFLQEAVSQNKMILFEGAQGTLLDLDYGTYPFVTSSNTVAAQASIGSGIGPKHLDTIVGIVKAYTTRVGAGPLPTELHDDMGAYLREKGGEYGATTGRPRRCGWFDLVVVRHAIRLSSMTHLVLTKLDVLSGLTSIKVCTGYKYRDQLLTHVPADCNVLQNCRPVYEELEGWQEDISHIKHVDELPEAAKNYIRYIERQTATPIIMLSLGDRRDEAIVLENPFVK